MKPICKQQGLQPYEPTWRAMQALTDNRDTSTEDEIWFLQHPPTFTLGTNTDKRHLLFPGDIPVVQIDRGGQVTYHGPGQLVVYPLLELARYRLGVRDLVTLLENAMIELLDSYGITAAAKADAPGVYVDDRKIGSLGLRIRRGASYHGLSLNVDMDLQPFQRINPCGFSGLEMTQISDFLPDIDINIVSQDLQKILLQNLSTD